MKRMTLDQSRDAMVEITLEKSRGSKLKKNFPEQYAIYEKEIAEIKNKGGIVEIPPEVP